MLKKFLNNKRKKQLVIVREILQTFSFFTISVIVGFFLYGNQTFHSIFIHPGNFEVWGVFLAGALFAVTPTVAVSGALLLVFSDVYNLFIVCALGALGGTITDLMLFKFIKKGQDGVYVKLKEKLFKKYKHSQHLLTIVGFIIILSPLPDELGVSLIGNSKISYKLTMVVCYLSNFVSIYTLLFVKDLYF